MRMLAAGGVEVVTDGVRSADDDNPRGYYEFEAVKGLAQDSRWVAQARGKAVKVISALLPHLPAGQRYKVLFLRRALEEVLASQRQMLIRRGAPTDKVSDERMAALFERHLDQTDRQLSERDDTDVLDLDYRELVRDPAPDCERIISFLGRPLDASAMQAAVDPKLYRQRVAGGPPA